jgi:hypothetical protein
VHAPSGVDHRRRLHSGYHNRTPPPPYSGQPCGALAGLLPATRAAVNNAGYGYRAAVEEGDDADVQRLFAAKRAP